MPDWRARFASAFSLGLLRAKEKPTLEVLRTVVGPIPFSFGKLCQGRFAEWNPEVTWRTQWDDLPPGGSLVLDDTVNAKLHTCCTEGAHRCFSGQHGRVLKGQVFLALLYVPPQGAARLLWLKLWQPGGPSKLEAMRQMVEQVLASGLKPLDVSFDGWYCNAAFCNWLAEQGLIWTSRIQRNRKFFFSDGRYLTPEQWQQCVPIESWHYYRDRKAYAKAAEVTKHDLGAARLLALKHRRHGKVERYLITNDLDAGVRTIIARYRRRWVIEVAFRFSKQKLGFSTYRYQTIEAAERHIALVGLTWNFLAALSIETCIPIGRLKRQVERALKLVRTEDFRLDLWKGAA